MTKKKGKKSEDKNMSSNTDYRNNGKDSSNTSNFNSHNQNASGRTRNNSNSYDVGHQKRTGDYFKYDQDSKHQNSYANKVRGQNTNYVAKFGGGGPNMSHPQNSYNKSGEQNDIGKGFGRGYAMQESNNYSKKWQQIDQKEPFNNDEGSNYLSTFNDKARGQNTSNVTNVERVPVNQSNQKNDNFERFIGPVNDENSQQIVSTNFQNDVNSRNPLNLNKAIEKVNVEFMSQDKFLENFHSAKNSSESMGSEIKNRGNLLEPKRPVPFPRTLTSKSEDEEGKGARKKQKGNNDKNPFYGSGYCMTCEKYLAQREFHKDHRVLPIDKAIIELKEQDQSKIVTVIEELNSQLTEEMQTKDIINLYEKNINSCLLNVFKKLKTSSNRNTDQLNQIRDSGMQIINSSSIDNITNMMSFLNFRDESQKIITMNQKLLSDLKYNSCWLIFSWFKMSIGLIIQSGVKIFTELESKTSAPSYANFDLCGDRLRLFSFKRNITPEGDAVIFPFESIRALFKNEDSKSFMIVGNNDQEGQVVIRINKKVFWGQQFISLCLGDLGPSLRNTRFFRSCGKGKLYHHIWGGDYSQNDGSGGEVFLPWDEPLKQSSESVVKGLLAARYGHNDKSSIFRIYIKGSEQTQPTKENFCFGHVEEGMENLEFFASQSDLTKATVIDAGCFLVLK